MDHNRFNVESENGNESPDEIENEFESTSKHLISSAYDDRFLVELSNIRNPREVLDLLRSSQKISLKYLNGDRTCNTFRTGNLLGKGKSAAVYELEEQENKGVKVVIKEFLAKESIRFENGIYVLSSALNDIVMSSLFHSYYAGQTIYSITFPYAEGYFVCGSKGYEIIEKMEMTLSKFFDSRYEGRNDLKLNVENFRIVMFQVLYSTKFLNYEEVMHNDMHAKNIMIRYTHGSSYRGVPLDDVKYFAYKDGSKEYHHHNLGIIAKVVDFDFSAKFSEPSIVAEKVYRKRDDNWNIAFRFACSYDILTFVAYTIFYTIIRTPNIPAKELTEIRRIIENISDYIVEQTEKQVGRIQFKRHLAKDVSNNVVKRYVANEHENHRTSISKLMDMVTIPQYRPYEEYCHIKLDDILEIDAFRKFREKKSGSLMVASF
jgi:hypothetical protein